ncbi:hypothetical protein AAFC00_003315 [Neodothiora populina]|uniref:Regulator of volume decrease after cellular swelling-domain-containing protein n=1 Tax=Neodothiora populina TaxID=2781224 RepID=A0ABR3PA00_9PEZI
MDPTSLTTITTPPSLTDYTSLSEHQSSTPGTFFGGKPVLYYHASSATLTLLSLAPTSLSSSSSLAPFSSLLPSSQQQQQQQQQNGISAQDTQISSLDVWITSSSFTIFSPQTGSGVAIPYPLISLHARQGSALYCQLCLSDMNTTADEDLETVEFLVSAAASSSSVAATNGGEEADESADDARRGRDDSAAEALFAAVSACADLHPDPVEQGSGDGDEHGGAVLGSAGIAGLGSADMPGAGGWITSENMHEYVDEDGDFSMPEGGLGAGAGTVRTAEEARFDDAVDGGDAEEGLDEQGGDHGKWRRTG